MRIISITCLLCFYLLRTSAQEQPNILWITSEDNSPMLGCYGDTIARTPHLDTFAKQSTRYTNCFSNAAVCAPARQTLITGVYSTSLGGQHMRSRAIYPEGVSYFPKYLKQAGYYTTNNSKTDYNGNPTNGKSAMSEAWDASNSKGHWRNRPTSETPFFAVFNIGNSHESNLFPNKWKKRELKTDPSTVVLPSFLPDTPEIRLDMARYYDCLETMDSKAGEILNQLKTDDLAEDTIVFYFSDHGGSMPRGKSFAYDSGTNVPLLIRIPEKWQHLRPTEPGKVTDQLVSFVDFAPTLLSLTKGSIPAYMQGSSFLGERKSDPREFIHTFRGRRGERYDLVRGVRSKEFLYIRNYTPHLPVMQFNAYSFEIPSYQSWSKAVSSGSANEVQAQWFEPKQPEELYRVADDPDNVNNLASDPGFAEILQAHRKENARHIKGITDTVFFPEGMSGRQSASYANEELYPLNELIKLGRLVSERDPKHLPIFKNELKQDDRCRRYWAVMGCIVLGEKAIGAKPDLVMALSDPEPLIQIQAARALAGMGATSEALPIIRKYTEKAPNEYLVLRAVLAIDECDLLKRDPSLKNVLKKAKGSYTKRVVEKLLAGK